jgi:hypothetical protein
MMFGALGRSTASRATAGAMMPRESPDAAASPAPICSRLRRVVAPEVLAPGLSSLPRAAAWPLDLSMRE